MRGELDWIVMSAWKRTAKIATKPPASRLGDDVQRYLNDQPVEARKHNTSIPAEEVHSPKQSRFGSGWLGPHHTFVAGRQYWVGGAHNRGVPRNGDRPRSQASIRQAALRAGCKRRSRRVRNLASARKLGRRPWQRSSERKDCWRPARRRRTFCRAGDVAQQPRHSHSPRGDPLLR